MFRLKLPDLQSVSKTIGFDVKQMWSMENKSDLQKWSAWGELQKIHLKFNDSDNVICERKKNKNSAEMRLQFNRLDAIVWSLVAQKTACTNASEVIEPILCAHRKFPEILNGRKTCTILTRHQPLKNINCPIDIVFVFHFFLLIFRLIFYDSFGESFIN